MKINCGLVGLGDWGKNLARALSSLGALYAIADHKTDFAAQRAAELETGVMTFDEMIESPAIKAIVLATPADTHYALARKALQAGKHVFVEKPLSFETKEGQTLIQMAQQQNLRLMAGHLLLYHPIFQAMVDQIRSGLIGQLRMITSERLNFGKFFADASVLWDLGPHDLSMVLKILSDETSLIKNLDVRPLFQREGVMDACSLTFTAGAVNVLIHLSRLSPQKSHLITAVGEKGFLVFDDTRPWEEKLALTPIVWHKHIATQEPKQYINVPAAEPLRQELSTFLKAIGQNKDLWSWQQDLQVVEILQKCGDSLV